MIDIGTISAVTPERAAVLTAILGLLQASESGALTLESGEGVSAGLDIADGTVNISVSLKVTVAEAVP
jgi:hypothetical protein